MLGLIALDMRRFILSTLKWLAILTLYAGVVVAALFVWAGWEELPPAEGAFEIEHSLRFNDDDSAYLSRTPGSSPTDGKKWTISFWVKKAANPGSAQWIFTGGSVPSNVTLIGFNSSEKLQVALTDSVAEGPTTDAVFRDPSAWMHVVAVLDTTQSVQADRVKIYVNNELQSTTFSGTVSQNSTWGWNSTNTHNIGRYFPSANAYFDGYVSDVYNIDGQALTPSSFGETDSNGYWRPKAYAGSYGTNGFHLDFANSGDLGNDVSGTNNDWTANNLDTTDWVVDTPTNSYATGNPLAVGGAGTFSQGNLANTGKATSTIMLPATGVWYWEVYAAGSGVSAGVMSESGVASTTSIASGSTNGFAYDADSGKLYYASDNSGFTLFGSGYSGNHFPYVTGGSTVVNYGQSKNATSTATSLTYDNDRGGYFLHQF